jgi:hypothetical protein
MDIAGPVFCPDRSTHSQTGLRKGLHFGLYFSFQILSDAESQSSFPSHTNKASSVKVYGLSSTFQAALFCGKGKIGRHRNSPATAARNEHFSQPPQFYDWFDSSDIIFVLLVAQGAWAVVAERPHE